MQYPIIVEAHCRHCHAVKTVVIDEGTSPICYTCASKAKRALAQHFVDGVKSDMAKVPEISKVVRDG